LHTLSDIYLIVARSDVELRLAFCGKRGSRHSSDLHRCRGDIASSEMIIDQGQSPFIMRLGLATIL